MLIGIDRLLNLCDSFIEDNISTDYECVDISTDFECIPNTKEVFISIVALENALGEFIENLKSRTEVDDISEFTWSFLHEIGHCQTDHFLNERTKNHCRNIKRKINRGSVPTAVYYTLAEEKIATDWAIRYVAQNHKLVKAFDRNALQLLTEIFVENDIDLEG